MGIKSTYINNIANTEGDCPTIIAFLKHIFGSSRRRMKDDERVIEVSSFEMGLDYFQLLEEMPVLKLPILCLYSVENNTGKSTLVKLMQLMFKEKLAKIDSADLDREINSHWATRLVVVCDNGKMKSSTFERVKLISTSEKIKVRSRNTAPIELFNRVKFALISNDPASFKNAGVRSWVLKVPRLKKENPRILEKFTEEMPAFRSFLSRRNLATQQMSRLWFHPILYNSNI